MTYCVAVETPDGLVFCSDSRTNAGPDILSSYSKMHIFKPEPDRLIVLLSAGNLATTQAVISQIEEDLDHPEHASLANCAKMVDVAKYVAQVSRVEQDSATDSVSDSAVNTSASFILGGQIRGAAPAIYRIYTAGNFISASAETPYLQIGESKYGKPILDRILGPATNLEDAARCALISMDSTIRANATVGPPVEILVYERDSLEAEHQIKLAEEDPYLLEIRRSWNEAIQAAFVNMPSFEWEDKPVPALHAVKEDRQLK
jgi:putative proteasome-type protease